MEYEASLCLTVAIEKILSEFYIEIILFPEDVLRMCRKPLFPIPNGQRIELINIELAAR